MNLYATHGYSYTIYLNDNTKITVYYLLGSGEYLEFSTENRIDLQWSLLEWCKSTYSLINNNAKSTFINLGEPAYNDGIDNFIFPKSENYEEMKNEIFAELNKYYNININIDSLNKIEIFLTSYSNHLNINNIFLNMANALEYIENQSNIYPSRDYTNIIINKYEIIKETLPNILYEVWG